MSGVAHHDQPPLKTQKFKEFGAIAPRNRVDNHVELPPALIRKFIAQPHLVIAEVEGESAFFFGADNADHLFGAHELGDLPELSAQTAHSGLHQHVFAGLQTRRAFERRKGGRGIGRNDRRQGRVHARRQGCHKVCLRQADLAEAAS